jgi:hypothetical protein
LVNSILKSDKLIEPNAVKLSESVQSKPASFKSKTNKKIDDYNFIENLQKLGLDDNKTSNQNLTNVQGSYLSFLLLRHLRIRDLKRHALSILNYFRSVEKTVTIYDGGLSFEAKSFRRQSAQDHSKETPYGANLGYHAYLYNSPKDFKYGSAYSLAFFGFCLLKVFFYLQKIIRNGIYGIY